jgi:hypothetical protein
MRGNIGAEINVIKPALPAQTHAEAASQETLARLPALQKLSRRYSAV